MGSRGYYGCMAVSTSFPRHFANRKLHPHEVILIIKNLDSQQRHLNLHSHFNEERYPATLAFTESQCH